MEFLKYIPAILISITVATLISVFWVKRIDYMIEKHFDYKGCDFLDEDDKNQIG